MVKLKVKDKITFNCSGVSISTSFCFLSIGGITLQVSLEGYLDDEECISLDCYFDDGLNVPVLVIDGFKFPLYRTIRYKNLDIYHRKF
ncbi:MAG: hypothetical protein JHC31_15455 [Sulfurihydrogenibium sp.]|jgi:hypothetical protein|nr:hypothetical protein [Sulfurihydrogenibium sp.]MBX0313135.1 hypothetical protein [Sulfurihydrogenibium sp.]